MKRGAALPTMLLVIAMTSALAVGGAYAARQLASNARNAERGADLEPIAESALVRAVAAWDSVVRGSQPIGQTAELPTTSPTGVRVEVWITRLDNDLYWLVAVACGPVRPRLARRLGLAVRITNGAPTPVSQRSWSELP